MSIHAGPIVLSTEHSHYFAKLIAEKLSLSELIHTERKLFGDGERYFRFNIGDSRKAFFKRDVVIVASTMTDHDFSEMCLVGTSVAGYGAHRLIFVIPYFGYSTMERAVSAGEVVMAKVNAHHLSQLPRGDVRNCFLMLDLHTPGLVHYFEGECLRFELYAESVLVDAIAELNLSNFMFASADLGRPRRVEMFAQRFQTPIAFVRKTRNFDKTEVQDVVGEVEGKIVVIYDDMVRSGVSLVHAAEAYLEKGAADVYAVISHLALNNEKAIDVLMDSPIKTIIATNSHPMTQHKKIKESPRFVIKDTSHMFAESISELL